MMLKKYSLLISRLIVGALFIVSGLIKANDVLGFSYKMEEYVAPDVLNWVVFQGIEVPLSAIVCIAEILLGVAVLAGEKFRLASWSLLLLIIFFAFLTGYTAIGNWFFEHPQASLTHTFESIFSFDARGDIHYFKDCGCFGDALQLTPMQSFLKDVVLLVFILIIFIQQKTVKANTQKEDIVYYGGAILLIFLFSVGVLNWFFPVLFSAVTFALMWAVKRLVNKPELNGWLMAGATTVICTSFTLYTLGHLPIRDFRPYAIGKNIEAGMEIPEGQEPPQYAVNYTMQSQTSGETQVVSSIDYLQKEVWKNKDLKIIETSEQFLVKEGYVPPIHDFVLEDLEDGSDRTSEILSMDIVALWVCYNINTTYTEVQPQVSALSKEMEQKGIHVVGLTAGLYDDVENFRHTYDLEFPFLTCDGTTLKTVIRSNPGLVLLKNGTVVGKWHHNDIPTFEQLNAQLELQR